MIVTLYIVLCDNYSFMGCYNINNYKNKNNINNIFIFYNNNNYYKIIIINY